MSYDSQASLTLDQVSKLFSNWRETRTARGQIPDSLWKAVAQIKTQQSISKTAKVLRLNCPQLKRKLQEFGVAQDHVFASAAKAMLKPIAKAPANIQVTKIVAVERLTSNVTASVEVVSPSGWVLRSTGPIKELQIVEFARAVFEVTV
jgi:hypothetical protein